MSVKFTKKTQERLESIGLNHLEIIYLDNMVGVAYDKLPIADIEMLELLKETKNVSFDTTKNNKRKHVTSYELFDRNGMCIVIGLLVCEDEQGQYYFTPSGKRKSA